MSYDSAPDTRAHIERVRELLKQVEKDLAIRGFKHDVSKLREPEKSAFDRCTHLLAVTEYNTPEYWAAKEQLGEALQHHYRLNDHHPEHHGFGIKGMSLMQLMEMLADWKAAGERHADGGDLRSSIEQNAIRFDYGHHITWMLMATADQLGWI